MVQLVVVVSGEIDWLESIGLLADTGHAPVDDPGLVSVPKSPLPVNDPEVPLEAFPQAPLGGLIEDPDSVVHVVKVDAIEGKESLPALEPPDLQESRAIDLHLHGALLEEGIGIPTHLGPVPTIAIDIKPGMLLKLLLLRNAD